MTQKLSFRVILHRSVHARDEGIEPPAFGLEPNMLPLHQSRFFLKYSNIYQTNIQD